MTKNLIIDTKLLDQALQFSGLPTEDTVNLALQEFVERRKQLQIINLFGKMEPDSDYDYKKGRSS